MLNPKAPLKAEDVEALAREAPQALVHLVMVMQEQLVELRAEIGRLQARVAELEEQNRPPSAPFRRREEERSGSPKKPGRPPGHPGSCRRVPSEVDEEIEVELGCCPHCAGALEAKQPLVQYLEELPPVRAHVTRLKTYEAHCPRCQRLVRSVHPRQTSTAGGCAGVQLGARALAVAVELKHELGLSLSKVAKALSKVGGLKVSRGGLALAYQRISAKVAGEDAALRAQLAKAPVLHTDETSWWVNGPASLWVFVVPGAQGLTLYRVVAHRDRVTFHSTVPPDYGGLLISDCLSVYDGATPHQHKCYAHHLRALRVARRDQHPQNAAASPWLTQVRAFLEATMELKIRWPTLADLERARQRAQCEVLANALFAQPRGDPAEERFRARIAKQRDHLLNFLDHPQAEATNNLAERQLRPAVIARKVSCGQKTPRGAAAWEILASLAATCAQRAEDFVEFLAPRLRLSPEG